MQTTVEEPTAIYVDASCGDDRADGATPATAIASLERLESFTLKPGTRVLFRAGGPDQVEIVGNDFTLDSDGHDQVCWDTHPIVRDNRFAGSYDYGDLWMTGQDRSQ